MSKTIKGGKGCGYEYDSFWKAKGEDGNKDISSWNYTSAKDTKRHISRTRRRVAKEIIKNERD